MRKLSFLVLALIFSASSFAQTLIPKVGGNFSNIAASDDNKLVDEDYKFKLGLTLGVAFEIGISDALAIQPELLFQQKGAMQKPDDGKFVFNLNYLELPVMVKYKTSSGFYLNAGPYVAYGLGGKLKLIPDSGSEESIDIKFGDEPDNENEDALYIDNALDFGFQVGVGMVIIEKIVIDLRYGHGLTNMFDAEDGYDNKFQNRSLQLTVGYPISFN